MKKQSKFKTYVLMLSTVFPKRHPKAGEPTNFNTQICETKIHTIRANFELWKKRFEDIEDGWAELSVRIWSGKPYKSKQIEIAKLTKYDDEIGIQRLSFARGELYTPVIDEDKLGGRGIDVINLAKNDGLSLTDWESWFKDYDLTKPMAIIHFTNFRY